MSSAVRGARSASPIDQDLQNLYNEVWAGFGDEPPSGEGDLDNIYRVYSGESDYPISTNPTSLSNARTRACDFYLI